MDTGMILGGVAVFFVVAGVGGYLFSVYNELVMTQSNVQKAWGNIDVLLKERHDEIPKLITACESYMAYERATIQKVVDARAAYVGTGSVAQKAQASDQVSGALRSLFAVAENYPALRADDNFMQLQSRITGLEQSLAERRELYNETVNNYNISIRELPNVFIANWMGLQSASMFAVDAADREPQAIAIQQPPA